MTITAPHCIRSINTQIAASSDALYFINFFITFNEKAIAHDNIPKDMTVNSTNTFVSITTPPLLHHYLFHSLITYLLTLLIPIFNSLAQDGKVIFLNVFIIVFEQKF